MAILLTPYIQVGFSNFYIISFLGIWGRKGGYGATQKLKLPKSRHCGLTAQVPCYVLLLSSAVSMVLFTLFAFLLFDVLGLPAPFPRVSPFLYHAVPGSKNTLLQRAPPSRAFSSFSKMHECCKASTSSSVLLTKTKQSCLLLWTPPPSGKCDFSTAMLGRCL